MRIGFIGAGKVGFSLGKYLVTNGNEVSGYYNRNPEAAKEAAEFTNTRFYLTIEELLRDSEVVFVTVSDGAIKDVWSSLKAMDIRNKIICHCSGALSSAIFSDITEVYGYSVHPFFAVSSRLESYKELSKALFTIEGPEKYRDFLAGLIQTGGARTVFLPSDCKIKYHAAAVFASNLMCGLMETAIQELIHCGFSENEAKSAIMPLAINNILHMENNKLEDVLTGPIARNDVDTVKKHLMSIDGISKDIYISLSKRTLDVAKRKNKEFNYKDMEELLNG